MTVTDGINCLDSANVVVLESPTAPVADFSSSMDEAFLLESTITFTNLSFPDTAFLDYLWDFGDGHETDTLNAVHTFNDSGTFFVQLIVFDSLGCTDTIIKPVRIKGSYILFAPNTFTPNGDGINDYFFPNGIGINWATAMFHIYNRWGDLIYEWKREPEVKGWDGKANNGRKMAQEDVYVWLIRTVDFKGKDHEYYGHVTLIR